MNLHNEIMNLPAKPYPGYDDKQLMAYKYGHKDARHAAAELALKAEEQIEMLRDALQQCKRWHQGDKWRDGDTEQREAWEGHLRVINNALGE